MSKRDLLQLVGLRYRGVVFDVSVDGAAVEIRTDGRVVAKASMVAGRLADVREVDAPLSPKDLVWLFDLAIREAALLAMWP